MPEVYLVFRVLKGATFTASQLVCSVSSEAEAQRKVQELDSLAHTLAAADLVQFIGNGAAQSMGKKVADVMGMWGIQQIGHMWAKSEIGGNIIIPKPRLVVPA